jgi:Fe-Mn family superoxide dismutase
MWDDMSGRYSVKENLLKKLLAQPFELSANLINQHFDLYKGYVTNANALINEIKSGAYSGQSLIDRRRRLGFEINGVVLHELFFENLTPATTTAPPEVQSFFTTEYGTFDKFIAEVENAGSTRGVGWVGVFYDAATKSITTEWIEEHHLGTLANVEPILLLDCWEHAFIVDFKSTGRGAYVKAALKHIDWAVVQTRITAALSGKSVGR